MKQTPNVNLLVLNPRSDNFSQLEELANLNLVLVKAPHLSTSALERIVGNLRGLVADCGSWIVHQVELPNFVNGHGRDTNGIGGEDKSEADVELESNGNYNAMMNGHRTPTGPDLESNSKSIATGIWERHRFAKIRHTAAGSIIAEAAIAHPG